MRMSACNFRIVLADMGGTEYIGFVISANPDECEIIKDMLDWGVHTHDGWGMAELTADTVKIKGIRIANNMFHAEKITLQGELLE